MNMDKLIARINELARKHKSVGLNSEELAERAALREQYIVLFRQQVRNKLDTIRYVEDEEGEQNNQPGSTVH
ncbi:DUF896 domain-containing protein [Paenibacillus dendritiformis]|uniref:DUF896 domain-containing protein n=1 Tax=Paenibacillus dendritiformis TaxID=130049 RepID=UPI00364CCFE5